VRVHLAGEHAPELERFDALYELVDVSRHGHRGAFVVLGLGQLQQFVGAAEAFGQFTNASDDAFERGAFLA
jgi:hypothetical protein